MKNLKDMPTEKLQELRDNVSAELLRREKLYLFHEVAKEYMAKGRIQAIKMVRGCLGLGLRDAKLIVDYWAASDNWTTLNPVETFGPAPVATDMYWTRIHPLPVTRQ